MGNCIDLLSTFIPFQAVHTASVTLLRQTADINEDMIILRNIFTLTCLLKTLSLNTCTNTHTVSDLKLGLQPKSFDEGVGHMIGPLEGWCSLVLNTCIFIRLVCIKWSIQNVNNAIGWGSIPGCVWQIVSRCGSTGCCLLTHSDLPVQDVSGDVDSSHVVTTKHQLGSGVEMSKH